MTWYRANGRELPWRRTRDPYAIWLSEVMCQQTQVATVIPYWERWMVRFPTVKDLATASEQEVLSAWAGLGYYRRARNLHKAAKQIANNGFPKTYAEWLRVPGVGEYSAGAIASICLNEATPAIDGNARRVFARLHAFDGPGIQKAATTWAREVIAKDMPGDWNQALMELGATICRYRGTQCESCPVNEHCQGKQNPLGFPCPSKVEKSVKLFRYVALCQRDGRYAVRQTPAGQWGEGLWEFPTRSEPWRGEVVAEIRHVVTRHRIRLLVQVAPHDEFEDYRTLEEIDNLPMTSAQRKVLAGILG